MDSAFLNEIEYKLNARSSFRDLSKIIRPESKGSNRPGSRGSKGSRPGSRGSRVRAEKSQFDYKKNMKN